jgi:hypothetical protein
MCHAYQKEAFLFLLYLSLFLTLLEEELYLHLSLHPGLRHIAQCIQKYLLEELLEIGGLQSVF